MKTRQAVKIALSELEYQLIDDCEDVELDEILEYDESDIHDEPPASPPIKYTHDSKRATLKRRANRMEKEIRLGLV